MAVNVYRGFVTLIVGLFVTLLFHSVGTEKSYYVFSSLVVYVGISSLLILLVSFRFGDKAKKLVIKLIQIQFLFLLLFAIASFLLFLNK